MDAFDWCLSCSQYLENNEGPYCSDACRASQVASSSPQPNMQASTSHPTPHLPAFAHRRSYQQQPTPSASSYGSAYSEDLSVSQCYSPSERRDSASAWIGKGAQGIYEWTRQIPPGPPPHTHVEVSADEPPSSGVPAELDPLRPTLLNAHSPRRPVPPKLFVSSGSGKTHPAPPVPSRPILAAQTSMPSLTSHSATASLSSIATPGSLAHASRPASARTSMHIPSKPASENGEEDQGPPSAETQKPTLFGNLKDRISAQVKSWAAGTNSALVNHPPYSTSHQLYYSGTRPPLTQRSPTMATVRGSKLPPASVSVYDIDSDLLALLEDEVMTSGPLRSMAQPHVMREVDDHAYSEKRSLVTDDHPAFLTRGRRAERAVC